MFILTKAQKLIFNNKKYLCNKSLFNLKCTNKFQIFNVGNVFYGR